MTEFIHLIGAEDVRSAGFAIRTAAEQIQGAAGSMEDSLQRHRMFLDDWLYRLEDVLKKEEED